MKIDIDKIIIRNKENKTYTISCYSRTDMISLLVMYQRKELSLCLFGYKNEIRIPFDQLKGIKYDEGIFGIVMNHGFRRTYYEHSDKFPYIKSPLMSTEDPTRGIITDAVEFQMFPKNTEHPNRLIILEAGLNRICFKDDENEFSKDSNLIQGVNNSFPRIKFEKFNFSPSWIEYYDPMVGEKISVTIEQDWDLAKSINSRMKKPQPSSFIEIYLY
ncbi:910_t:CDS:2 [Diversispora eburnea]|uniref:910_t:CDS:1 n=1 Tax=Diversispora eburnea TaxID=1213867 RepID=A0A9N8VZM2_9GLOM|nr:910_t:CDS:2 [Diversispora eburnea]